MEPLRQRRTPIRATFTKAVNLIEEELKLPTPSVDKIASFLVLIEDKGEKLAILDTSICEFMQDSGCSQEEYDKEFEAGDAYQERLVLYRCKLKRLLAKLNGEDGSRERRNGNGDASSQRKYKLPEIEFKKFSGELRDWLGFWGQFRKIDEDDAIALEDKYQYLLQATVVKSKAREIVESFPPTAENYAKAIEHLKSRFGREDTLVEVYVRDLLRLVLNNSMNPKNKIRLSELYDKLETQLRALETLGVASEKYAAMLYHLVESCVPDDILRAWDRSRNFSESGVVEKAVPNRLKQLMHFLRSEVESEERIAMARSGFALNLESNKKRNHSETSHGDVNVPTAAGLFSGTSNNSTAIKRVQKCIFCEKEHRSIDCQQARQMTLDQRRQHLEARNACFRCLQIGHMSKTCRSKVRCLSCQGRHFVMMCPNGRDLPKTGGDESKKRLVQRFG